MRYGISVSTAAERDLADALAWYDGIARDLGDQFDAEIRRAFTFVRENPFLYQKVLHDKRRIKLPTFPYVIIYAIKSETVVVMAVFHTSRAPNLWQLRR